MSIARRIGVDSFNTFCDNRLGSGAYRDVFAMRFDASKVVKIERTPSRRWCNVLEYTFWNDWKDVTSVAEWLAPCHHLSESGHILIMDRTTSSIDTGRSLPAYLPRFLTDIKAANFGYIGKHLVCHDYAFVNSGTSTRKRRINWNMDK